MKSQAGPVNPLFRHLILPFIPQGQPLKPLSPAFPEEVPGPHRPLTLALSISLPTLPNFQLPPPASLYLRLVQISKATLLPRRRLGEPWNNVQAAALNY